MNIWILNHYAGSPDRAGVTRDYDRGRNLVARGHSVTIFSSSFSHYGQGNKLALGEKYRLEMHNGVKFVWVKTAPYSKSDRRRVMNMMSFAWRSYWIGRRIKESPDIIIGTSVHLLTPLAAYLLARVKHSRFCFEVTDLWPQSLVEMGALSDHHPITWGLRRLEKFLYRRAERIFTVLPHTGEYIARLGIPSDKVVWIPNGVDLRNFEGVRPYAGGDPNNFKAMYVGGLSPYHGLDVIIDAAKILKDTGDHRITFVLVGDGSDRQRLEQCCKELGLHNVEFRGTVPKSELYKVTGEADAFLYPLMNMPLLRYGISPNKVCDYMASGRPIIYLLDSGNSPFEEADAGISGSSQDPQALIQAVRRLIGMSPDERIRLGKNGQAFVKSNYDIMILAERVEQTLQSALSESKKK